MDKELKIQKLDSFYHLIKKKNDIEALDKFTRSYSFWFYRNKDKRCFPLGEETIQYAIQNTPEDTISIQLRMFNLARYHYSLERDEKNTLINLDRALKFNRKTYIAGDILNYYGLVYLNKGDYYKAIEYYNLAEQVLLKSKKQKKLFNTYRDLHSAYDGLGGLNNYLKARAYLIKMDSLNKVYPSKMMNEFTTLYYLGESYNKMETLDIPKALSYFDQAQELVEKHNDSLRLCAVLNRKGNLFNTTDYDRAISYYDEALKVRSLVDKDNTYIDHSNLGFCYYHKKDFDKSLFHQKTAFEIATGVPFEEASNHKEAIFNLPHISNLHGVLLYLGESYYAIGSKEAIKKSIQAYSLADEVLDIIRLESNDQQSRLFWRTKASKAYKDGITSCYETDDIEQLYYFIEKNKAVVLQEDIIYQQTKQNSTIPKKLIAKENELRKTIYILEKNESLKNNDSLKQILLAQKEQLTQVKDSISIYNANYSIKNNNFLSSLSEVQTQLTSDECILEYSLYDDVSYGLFISKETTIPFKIEDSKQLQQLSEAFLKQITKPFKKSSDKDAYETTALALYNSLVPKNIAQEFSKFNKVTIIPDSYLNKLPFEALITDDKNYLITSKEISYLFSNSFLSTLFGEKTKQTSAISFAPEAFTNLGLPTLNNSVFETQQINEIINGNYFHKEKATKEQFLNEIGKHSIIHLSTHAKANDSIAPWIAFYDEKINLDEIYLTNNQADLLVLSACETHTGKIANGEGVMSLTRGFFQTGTQSVLASLWSVNDRSTATIMEDFYKNLKLGYSKSKAIQLAKLNYIQNNSLSEASPYNWAPFILLGNTENIALPTSYTLHYIIGSLLLLVLFILMYFKRKKRLKG